MKLSAAASKVANQLAASERGQSWFRQILGKKNASPLLRKLGELNEPAALPDVAHFLTSTDRETRAAARETVAALLEQISAWDLLALEEQALWEQAGYRGQNWSQIRPADVAEIAGRSDLRGCAAVLSLLSFHKNGYVRQEAVRLLADIDTSSVNTALIFRDYPFLKKAPDSMRNRFIRDMAEMVVCSVLPALIIRQNDWVKPIAEAAQREVRRRINTGIFTISSSFREVELILQMETWNRYDHSDVICDMVKLLLTEEQGLKLPQLTSALTLDHKLCRTFVRCALTCLEIPNERLLIFGLISKDPVIRYQCCRGLRALPVEASEVLPLQDRMLFLERLTIDPFQPVRSEAFRQLAALDPANAVSRWEAALLDRSRSIQEMACYYLNQIDPGHAVQFYRDAVMQNPESLPAIEGLAAVGEASDLEFLRTLFVHPFPSRRCAGIRAVVRLLQRDAISEVMPFLRDSSPRVVRTAGKSLRPWITQIASADLLAVVLEADTLFARRHTCELLAEQGKWSSFPWLLEVCVKAEPKTAQAAAAMIQSWCSARKSYCIFTRPSAEERAKIGEMLVRYQSQIPEHLVQLIERELSLYS
ncbi:HEAT repeat domain-containing protein [Gimesia sp.]|uniref:HEAT repeat domain-containing protein n=1 Tax=Gimesia sp. TaxID=2024833 RepID=UPI003A91F8ED